MDAKQIKDEIRKLSRIDKTAIYKWIDEQAVPISFLGSEFIGHARTAMGSKRGAE